MQQGCGQGGGQVGTLQGVSHGGGGIGRQEQQGADFTQGGGQAGAGAMQGRGLRIPLDQ